MKGVRSSNESRNTSYTEKHQKHIPYSFAYKFVCFDDTFSKPVVLYKEKKTVHRFIEAILEEYNYCRGVIIIHFNKNLVMFEEDKQRIQSSNMCWICDKSFAAEDY